MMGVYEISSVRSVKSATKGIISENDVNRECNAKRNEMIKYNIIKLYLFYCQIK